MQFNDLQKELRKAAPKTSLNWERYRKKIRNRRIIIALATIVLIGAVGYFKVKKNNQNKALVQTVVAYESIEKGTLLTESMLSMRTFATHQLPDGYKTDISDLKDIYTVQNISKNSIITEKDLKKIVSSGSLALGLDDGTVAFTIDGDWVESTLPKLTAGDTIAIIVSHPERPVAETVYLVKRAEVMDFARDTRSASNSFVTIKITEEESRNIMYARSHKLLFSIVLTQ